jgi:predicted DNA-binding transcriptional regulator YafY
MERRKPTYGSAVRIARLILILVKSNRPVSLDRICDQLGISERTVRRYRKAINENLSSGEGQDLLKVSRDGESESWYLSDQAEILNGKYLQVVSLHIAMVILKSLGETLLADEIKGSLNMTGSDLKPSDQMKLEQFEKKFRHSGFGRKDYSSKNKLLRKILEGLIDNKKLQVRHYSHTAKKDKYHIIHPLTLLMHRDSLYLHAYVEGYRQIRTFAVDRIQEITARDEKFRYPKKFNPDQVTDGSFGIYNSSAKDRIRIVVSFKEILYEYLTTRRWHPSQRFTEIKDSEFQMEISLKNTDEFVPWVLQFGPDAKVLEPDSLRDEVREQLELTIRRYEWLP